MKSLLFFTLMTASLTGLAGCSNNGSFTPAADSLNIIGGQDANPEGLAAQSTVALITGRSEILKENCTGTVISDNVILTAAHCLEKMRTINVWIHAGSKLPKPYYLHELYKVRDFIVHPQFAAISSTDFPDTEINDIAVILLDKKLPPSMKAVKIQVNVSPTTGDELLLAGFGVTDDRNTKRATQLKTAKVTVSRVWDKILVLDQTQGSGACNGDSGGPAYIEKDKELILVGVTRGAHNKSPHCHNYTEYTNATRFKDFILSSVKDMGGSLPTFYTP